MSLLTFVVKEAIYDCKKKKKRVREIAHLALKFNVYYLFIFIKNIYK